MMAGVTRGLAFPPRRSARILISILLLCVLLSINALAFNLSLQPEEVEKAYSLGKTSNHEELADFLSQYEHDFKVPADNSIAYVSSVEFQTPYEQIVLRSLRTTQYSKFQAQEDYQADPTLVIVRVIVALKTGYSGPEPPADSFKVVVSQAKPIEPRNVTGTVLCNPLYTTEVPTFSDCVAYTREILLQFDAVQFAPGRATVKVTVPYRKSMQTSYDLDKLK
jgi:hypothetical protein